MDYSDIYEREKLVKKFAEKCKEYLFPRSNKELLDVTDGSQEGTSFIGYFVYPVPKLPGLKLSVGVLDDGRQSYLQVSIQYQGEVISDIKIPMEQWSFEEWEIASLRASAMLDTLLWE